MRNKIDVFQTRTTGVVIESLSVPCISKCLLGINWVSLHVMGTVFSFSYHVNCFCILCYCSSNRAPCEQMFIQGSNAAWPEGKVLPLSSNMFQFWRVRPPVKLQTVGFVRLCLRVTGVVAIPLKSLQLLQYNHSGDSMELQLPIATELGPSWRSQWWGAA